MKRIFILMSLMSLFIVTCLPSGYSQVRSEQIVVNKSDLTPTQVLKFESDAKIADLQKKLETYGNWVGIGGEIGSAVKESLTAVVDVADKFGKTDVGRFTMVMVAWKIIGKDIVRIVIGLVFLCIFTIFMFRHYKKNFTTYKVALKTNGWKFWLPKEYQLVEPTNTSYDGYEFVKWLNILMLLGGFGITYAIMFG